MESSATKVKIILKEGEAPIEISKEQADMIGVVKDAMEMGDKEPNISHFNFEEKIFKHVLDFLELAVKNRPP